MALTINSNLMAANASRNLGAAYGELETSTRRLSSGLRVNQASDDAAGLAVRELMRADITALNQGIRNANDAISLIQTADGALGVIDEKLIRMKELAMQASTGTYNSDQRLIIDSEYQAMASEITRIANSTDFNGIHLLNGNLSGSHDGSGLTSTGKLKVHFGTSNDCAEDYYYINIDSATADSLGVGLGGAMTLEEAAIALRDEHAPSYNLKATISTFGELDAGFQNPFNNVSSFSSSNSLVGYYDGIDDIIVVEDDDGDFYFALFSGNGASVDRGPELYTPTDGSGGPGASISTQQLAQQALDQIENAIISKDKIRANLGALQNRLENTVTVLELQAENTQAAESRISDVDVAKEMTQFVRNQIMTQAAISMLSQANSLPRMALSLIG